MLISIDNALASAKSITASHTMDANYPATALVDGVPGRAAAFAAAAAGQNHVFNLSIEPGGTMDVVPATGWSNVSTGTGDVAIEGTIFRAGSGTKSVRVTGGASGVGIYRLTKRLRTGGRYRLVVYGRNTTSATCKVRVSNAETRNSLQSAGGAWSAASADVASTATTSFVAMNAHFTVESFEACGRRARVTVYIDLVCTQNENVYFDDFDIWPEIDLVGVFGHNLDAGMAPTIRSSTDNFSASNVLEATLTVQQPAFYKKLSSPITRQYVAIVFPTVNTLGPPRIGELFGGQYLEPARAASAVVGEFRVSRDYPQIVSDFQSFATSDLATDSVVVPVQLLTAAHYKEFRDEIIERTRGAITPIVIVPDVEGEPDLVLFGRLATQESYKRVPIAIRETSLVVQGLPYETVVN